MSSTDHHDKNPARVAAGLKAALHNPRVSSTAKLGAQEKLNEMWASEFKLEDGLGDMLIDGKKLENIVRGYKATVNNPRVSGEAKEHAIEVLRCFQEGL